MALLIEPSLHTVAANVNDNDNVNDEQDNEHKDEDDESNDYDNVDKYTTRKDSVDAAAAAAAAAAGAFATTNRRHFHRPNRRITSSSSSVAEAAKTETTETTATTTTKSSSGVSLGRRGNGHQHGHDHDEKDADGSGVGDCVGGAEDCHDDHDLSSLTIGRLLHRRRSLATSKAKTMTEAATLQQTITTSRSERLSSMSSSSSLLLSSYRVHPRRRRNLSRHRPRFFSQMSPTMITAAAIVMSIGALCVSTIYSSRLLQVASDAVAAPAADEDAEGKALNVNAIVDFDTSAAVHGNEDSSVAAPFGTRENVPEANQVAATLDQNHSFRQSLPSLHSSLLPPVFRECVPVDNGDDGGEASHATNTNPRTHIHHASASARASARARCASYQPGRFFDQDMPGYAYRAKLESTMVWDLLPRYDHLRWTYVSYSSSSSLSSLHSPSLLSQFRDNNNGDRGGGNADTNNVGKMMKPITRGKRNNQRVNRETLRGRRGEDFIRGGIDGAKRKKSDYAMAAALMTRERDRRRAADANTDVNVDAESIGQIRRDGSGRGTEDGKDVVVVGGGGGGGKVQDDKETDKVGGHDSHEQVMVGNHAKNEGEDDDVDDDDDDDGKENVGLSNLDKMTNDVQIQRRRQRQRRLLLLSSHNNTKGEREDNGEDDDGGGGGGDDRSKSDEERQEEKKVKGGSVPMGGKGRRRKDNINDGDNDGQDTVTTTITTTTKTKTNTIITTPTPEPNLKSRIEFDVAVVAVPSSDEFRRRRRADLDARRANRIRARRNGESGKKGVEGGGEGGRGKKRESEKREGGVGAQWESVPKTERPRIGAVEAVVTTMAEAHEAQGAASSPRNVSSVANDLQRGSEPLLDTKEKVLGMRQNDDLTGRRERMRRNGKMRRRRRRRKRRNPPPAALGPQDLGLTFLNVPKAASTALQTAFAYVEEVGGGDENVDWFGPPYFSGMGGGGRGWKLPWEKDEAGEEGAGGGGREGGRRFGHYRVFHAIEGGCCHRRIPVFRHLRTGRIGNEKKNEEAVEAAAARKANETVVDNEQYHGDGHGMGGEYLRDLLRHASNSTSSSPPPSGGGGGGGGGSFGREEGGLGPSRRHVVFAVVRDPISRFVSSVAQVLGMSGPARRAGKDFQARCRSPRDGDGGRDGAAADRKYEDEEEVTVAAAAAAAAEVAGGAEGGRSGIGDVANDRIRSLRRSMLRCAIEYLRADTGGCGLDVDVHLTPTATRLATYVLPDNRDVDVVIYPMEMVDELLAALGYGPKEKMEMMGKVGNIDDNDGEGDDIPSKRRFGGRRRMTDASAGVQAEAEARRVDGVGGGGDRDDGVGGGGDRDDGGGDRDDGGGDGDEDSDDDDSNDATTISEDGLREAEPKTKVGGRDYKARAKWDHLSPNVREALGGMSVRDMDEDMIRKVCDLYAVDVALMRYLGFGTPLCDAAG